MRWHDDRRLTPIPDAGRVEIDGQIQPWPCRTDAGTSPCPDARGLSSIGQQVCPPRLYRGLQNVERAAQQSAQQAAQQAAPRPPARPPRCADWRTSSTSPGSSERRCRTRRDAGDAHRPRPAPPRRANQPPAVRSPPQRGWKPAVELVAKALIGHAGGPERGTGEPDGGSPAHAGGDDARRRGLAGRGAPS